LIAIGLLIFTGFRSIHLVQSTLPGDAQVLGFAALAALDFGVLGWTFYANGGARGSQRMVAILMVIVDMAGVAAAVIADTLLVSTGDQYGSLVTTVAAWILPIVVVANVAATISTKLMDPDVLLANAKREVSDSLELGTINHLRQNQQQIAARAMPEAAQHVEDELVSGFRGRMMGARGSTPAPATLNGHQGPVTLGKDVDGPETVIRVSRPKRRAISDSVDDDPNA
jgi:hypothetical protein